MDKNGILDGVEVVRDTSNTVSPEITDNVLEGVELVGSYDMNSQHEPEEFIFLLPDGSVRSIEKQFIPQFLKDNPDAEFQKDGTMQTKAAGFDSTEAYGDAYSKFLKTEMADATPTQKDLDNLKKAEDEVVDLKSNDIRYEDFNGKSEEKLVEILERMPQYADRFLFSEDTAGMDRLQVYDKRLKKYFYVDLNTAYNTDQEQYARDEDGNYKIVNGELVPGGIKGTDVTKKGLGAYEQFLDIVKPNQGFVATQQPEYGLAGLGFNAETGEPVKAKEDYYYGIDRESKVPIIEDGKVVYKNVPLSETSKSGTFNPTIVEIEDDKGVKREIEVPDEVVIRAKELLFSDVAKYRTIEKAVKQVLEDDELLAGQMRLKSLMGGEREKEEKEVNNFITTTLKNENINLGDKYDNLTTENIDTFYTLGFPKWEREEEYLKAKQEFENLTWDTLPGGQPSAEYTRIAQQYVDIKNEREAALIPLVDEWLNNDPAGQKVFKISQEIESKKVEDARSTEAYAETKLNFPDLDDDQLAALTNAKISENIFTESYNAFEDNTYGFFLPEGKFKTGLLTTAKEFNSRQTELVKNREEAFIKYYKESGDAVLAKQKSLEEFPITKEDEILQNKLASLVHTWLNDDAIDIYKDIEGEYGNTIYSRGTSEERNEPGYVQSKVQQYQFADTDWLNKRIFKNNAEIISLATQLANKSDWYSTGSFAQQMYNVAGELMGSDQALNKDIARMQAIANSGKLPLHLTTIPNSDDPLVKRWNDAIEDRALMGVGKLLNVDWTTATREGFWGQAGNMGSGFDYQELDNNEAISRMFKEIKASGIELTDAEEMQTNEQIGVWERAGSAVPDLTRMGVEMAATFWLTGGASTLTNISRFIAGNTFRAAELAGMGTRTSANLTKFFTGVGTEFAALEGASIMDPLFDKEGMSMGHNFRLALTLGLGRAGVAKAGEKFNQALTGYSTKLANQGNYSLDNVIQLGNTVGLETVSSALKFSVLTPGTSAALMQVEGAVENIIAGEGMDKIFFDITNGEQLFETYASFVVMGLAHPSQGWKKAREVYENEVSRISGDHTMWNAGYLEAGLKPVRGKEVHSNKDIDKAIEKKISEVKASNVPKAQKINQIQHLNNLGNKLKLKEHFQQLDADIRNQELTAKNQASKEKYNIDKYEDLSNSQKKVIDKNYKDFNIYHNTRRLNATTTSLKAGNKPTPADMINLDRASQTNASTAIKALIESGYSNVNATNLVLNAKAIGTYCRLNYGTDLYSPGGQAYVFNAMEITKLHGELKGLEEQRKLSITEHEIKIADLDIAAKKKAIDDLYAKNEGIAEAKRIVDLETIGKEDIKRLEEAGVPIIEETTPELKKRFEEEFPGETFNENQGGWQFERDPREFIIDKTTGEKVENKNFGKPLAIINKNVAKASTIKHESWGHGSTDLLFAESALKERTDNILKGNNKLSPEEARQQAETEVLDYVEQVKEYVRKRGGGELEAVNERMTVTGIGGNGKWAEYVESVEAGGPRDLTFEKEWLSEFLELSTEKAFDLGKSEKDFGEVTTFSPTKMTPNEYAKFILEGGALATKGVVEALKADREARVKQEEKYGDETSKVSASEKISKASKEAADKNKSIETKIVDQGSGKVRIREIKDAKFQKQIKKELTDNNQTMIEVRARKAANNPRIQSLEPSKRISAEEFKSAFNKEFAEALGQYIPIVNGKRIPFGAYMNQRLTQRFKQALEKIKQGQFEGPEIRLQQPTREGKRGFDAESRDLNPEEAMIAKEGTYESKEIFKDRIDPRSEIIDPQKRTAWDKKIDTKFDKEFKDKEGKLDLEKLEELDYSTLKDFAEENTAEFFGIDVATLRGKNPRYSRTDKKGKIKVDEGIPKEAENYNLNKKLWDISEKYVKLLNETQLFPKDIIEADIKKAQETYEKNPTEKNKKALQKLKDIKKLQGEQKTGDQAKQGTSLGIDPSILKALYETSDIRAMTGPGPKIKSTRLNVDEFRERAGIQPPGKFKSRSLEKLTKKQKDKLRNEDTLKAALGRKWGDAVTSVRVREKLEQAKTEENKEAINKIQREIKAGSSRFSASEKVVKKLEIELKDFDKELLKKLYKEILKEPTLDDKRLYEIIKKISPDDKTTVKLFTEVKEVIKKAGSDFTDATTKRLEEERSASAEKQVIKDLQEQIKIEEGIDVTFKEAQDIYTGQEKWFKDVIEGLNKAGMEIEYFESIEKNILSEEHLPKIQEAVEVLLKDIEFDLLPKNIQKAIQASLTANTSLKFPDGTRANPENVTGKRATDKGYEGTGNYIEKVFNVPGVTKGNKSKTEKFVEKVKYVHIPEPGGFKKNSAKINREVDYKTNPTEWMNRHYELLIGKDLKAKVKAGEMSLKEAWELTDKHNTALKDWYFSRLNNMSPNAAMVVERLQTSASTGMARGATSYESISTRLEKHPSKVGTKEENVESHNEHIKERLNESKEFFAIYRDKNLSQAQKNLAYKKMVRTGGQYLIDKFLQVEKDATGKTIRISESDIANTLVMPGRGFDSVLMKGPDAGKTVGEVAIRDMGKKRLLEILDKAIQTVEVVEAKQQVEYKPNYNEIGKETISLVKEANMSTKPKFSASEKMSPREGREKLRIRDKAFELARKINKPVKKARVFDFDDTVARTKSNVLYEMPNGKKGKISAEEFAKRGGEMEAKGAKWDFSEFNKVVDGKKGPLFEVMKKMKEAAGERDMFILTARSPEAAKAIHKFLKEMGIDIPLENIKGLADSSPYAKSDWILEKASEGYNDFYFADDHAPNVKAVREVLEQIDVKSKVQQARMSASEKLDKDFNKILEEKSGIEWYKDFSKSKGKVVGARKGKYKIFLPPGAEDFTGLIYPTLGKGKKGEAQLEWYNDNLIKPYNRATRDLSTDKVQLMNDFKGLKKQLDMPKDLRKITKSGYTKEQAARVYLWDKMGEKIPNLTKTDLAELLDIVNSDGKLKAFADQILEATKGDGYSTPGENWLSGTMTTDLIDVLNVNKRKKYLEEWQENIDIIYSEKNLNKLEAIYGPKYREALENSIKRMKTGRNRTSTGNKASDALLDYINGAQGTIMFLNMRSAVLQSISAANFVNLSFNNPIKAGKAFINQKQYWKDFMSIMNSDYLVGRRQGLKLNISESEIADAAAGSKNKAKAAINYILEKGYAPTKFMDSFAIASGGATWYRNKIKDLMKKEGLSEVEAQKKAFEEFMEISEKSQQSSDPSKISKQQSSDMGRIFLQFANTPMQYARIQKRALQDLANKRGDWKSNIGKILYYGVIQNIWFNAMQQGLFALGFGDDEINEKEEKKIVDTANGMADSILRGTGFAGMTISVLKNTIIDLYRRSGRQQPKYGDAWMKLLEFSPAVKSKFGKLKSAAWPFDTKEGRKQIKEKGFSLDNPAFESGAKVISAATNIPLDRLFLKYNNLKAMMSEETETWKDIALFLGWPEYQLEEGGTVEEDKIRNMKNDTKKDEQVQTLLDLGYSKGEIRQLKNEENRVKAIINGEQGGKKIKLKSKSTYLSFEEKMKRKKERNK